MRFSRASKTYEDWAIPQKLSAQTLFSLDELKLPLLDVGCGTGFASSHIKGAIGLDISISMLRVYIAKGNRGVLGDAHNLPFRDKSFETVISNFSLHWTDLNVSVREISRVCKGVFLCSIPVEGSLSELGFPFPKEEDIFNILYRSNFNIREYKKLRLDIPFTGWELIRFFHYTGTSYNPSFNGVIMSRREMERMVSIIDSPFFDVLFFSCEVRV